MITNISTETSCYFLFITKKKITAGSSSQTSRPRRAAAHARFPFNEADPETKLGGTEVKLKQVPLLGLQGPADP